MLVHCHMNPKEITEIKEDTNEEIKDDKTVEKRTEIISRHFSVSSL